MKRFLFLLPLLSCQTPAPINSATNPSPATPSAQAILDALLSKDPSQYPLTAYWGTDYDAAITAAIALYPVQNMPCSPQVTLAGIALAESGLKRESVYHESFGWDSLGLMQLSAPQDESFAKCGLNQREDAFHPIRNLYCSIKIMNYNDAHYQGNFSQVQGKYWSSVRYDASWIGKERGGYQTVLQYWKDNGCPVN